ncbi:EamA family transporter RarD [Microbulbifer sp. 2205BS26-8]|uniref:EamA family transporter RarD n=1 Tax=Microbulbifer sp. 2205BS26-8 TaxID=3064386 RepID=UPI00273D16F7|nr:EamA family transporter RarD [Microbulbifer sp. 2205BS26-8]MDP5209659.1 EamA family transporter RarD [Microbulbifer sp. 2205BS26-8]
MRHQDSATTGLLAGVAAFFIWGLAPLYFHLLEGIPAAEILAHRSVWSLVLALLILALVHRLPDLANTLRNGGKMRMLALTALLIGSNWLVFIWAINNGHLLESSLGYYINPLLNIILGVLFLGEKLRRLQWLAVALATTGIAYELWQFGRVPVIALFLAGSFALYGLVRKRVPVESLTGLAVETLYMLPVALLYLVCSDSPTSNLLHNSWALNSLLVLAGPVTLMPLLLFTIAARRLNLSTVGFLQYIAPTLMLVIATQVLGEPFREGKLITFMLVWLGLILYTIDALAQRRKLYLQGKVAL